MFPHSMVLHIKKCKSYCLHCVLFFFFITDEDEDGDRITVRSDEEMKAMLSYVSVLQMRTVVKNVSIIEEAVSGAQ